MYSVPTQHDAHPTRLHKHAHTLTRYFTHTAAPKPPTARRGAAAKRAHADANAGEKEGYGEVEDEEEAQPQQQQHGEGSTGSSSTENSAEGDSAAVRGSKKRKAEASMRIPQAAQEERTGKFTAFCGLIAVVFFRSKIQMSRKFCGTPTDFFVHRNFGLPLKHSQLR